MTQMQVEYQKLQETERANQAKELENYRTNVANERIRDIQARASMQQANTDFLKGILAGLSEFTLTPQSQGTFFKNVGQGFGSSAQGAASIMKMVGGAG